MAKELFKGNPDKRPVTGSSVSVFRYHRQADQVPAGAAAPVPTPPILMPRRANPTRIWEGLPAHALDQATADAHHLIIAHQDDPVGTMFDILRTRMTQALEERGWTRIAICGPTVGCGASFVASNLALSLARRPSSRTVLVDLDLATPRLATVFGAPQVGPLRDMLTGDQPIESHMLRVGGNLALALNGRSELQVSELLQEPSTIDTLDALSQDLVPDVVLYDMPPVLGSDAVLAFLPQVDAVLLVADGTQTQAEHIRECERLFSNRTELLGVVLNRSEDRPPKKARTRS
ncbi:MAG: CpsD/CapB family tyrosine-protein kinase [Gemmobacter sp.]|nr:CpsD/CapB family tyrosine-protein kinase [Gemmobacter sp.]